MSYIVGEDRGKAALLPALLEDYVRSEAPVRVIGAFVDGLDMVRGSVRASRRHAEIPMSFSIGATKRQ